MKFFTNKSIWSKIVIALVIVLVFQFIVAKPSLGADYLEAGGKLIQPVLSLVLSLGDGAMGIIHSAIMGMPQTLHKIDLNHGWDLFKTVAKWVSIGCLIAAAAGSIVAAMPSGGLSLAALPAIGSAFAATVGNLATVAGILFFGDAVLDGMKSATGLWSVSGFANEQLPDTLYLPTYAISPEEIFQGKILLFNVDFFGAPKRIYAKFADGSDSKLASELTDSEVNNVAYFYYKDGNTEVVTSRQDVGEQLSATISKWYVALRNIGLVMMLIILLYIGIRMLLSTVSSDKAKYKQLLYDWFMGIVILFTIHYIMVFANVLVNQLTKVVSSAVDKTSYAVNIQDNNDKDITNYIKDKIDFKDESGKDVLITENVEVNGKKGNLITWTTNLLGSLRIKTQMNQDQGLDYSGYALCFCLLVILTITFIFQYIKRVLYMAFLTLIAPLVAVTYPIDKITDGSAQGFDKWMKEYIFTLLIQPMHLLLYYILVVSAFQLAGKNIVYAIVAITFMVPAEKLLRSFFGFEKAKTPGLLGGVAGTAVAMGAVKSLGKIHGPGGGKAVGNKSNSTGGGENEGLADVNYSKNLDESAEMAGVVPDEMTEEAPDGMLGAASTVAEATGDFTRATATLGVGTVELAAGLAGGTPSELPGVESPSDNINVGVGAEQEQNENNTLKASSKARRRAAEKRVLRQMAIRAPGNVAKFAGKFTRVAATLGAGTVGLAAGLATGDPSKAFQYGALGIAAGNSLGKTVSSSVNNTVDKAYEGLGNKYGNDKFESALAGYNRVKNSRQYENIILEDKKREMYSKNRATFSDYYSQQEDGKVSMVNMKHVSDICTEYGIDDAKDVIAINEMVERGNAATAEQAIAMKKYYDRMGKVKGTPEEEKWRNTLNKEFKEKANVQNEAARKVVVDKTMDGASAYGKIRSKL